jgi:predicted dehydrogenase
MNTSSKRRVRYVVVGLGNIAQVAVLPAFAHAQENSELVGIISSDDAKLRELRARYGLGVTGKYDALERILAEHAIDAVYIATPNTHHREFTVRAAAAHVHVLCEKPMAPTEADCREMIRATTKAGVNLMIAYRLHFEEANLSAIERVHAGEIGEPRVFSSVFGQQVRNNDIRTRADLGGGALFDMGVYCVNAARYIFRDEPVEVFARQVMGGDERFQDVDEMTTAILRFPDHRFAQLTVSQAAGDIAEFRVVGTKGDIRLDPAYGYVTERKMFVTVGGSTRETTFPKSDQFAPELVHFSQSILDGTDPEPSGVEGLEDVRIMEAMVRSARSGGPVRIAPIEPPMRPNGSLVMKKPPVAKVDTVHAPSPSK